MEGERPKRKLSDEDVFVQPKRRMSSAGTSREAEYLEPPIPRTTGGTTRPLDTVTVAEAETTGMWLTEEAEVKDLSMPARCETPAPQAHCFTFDPPPPPPLPPPPPPPPPPPLPLLPPPPPPPPPGPPPREHGYLTINPQFQQQVTPPEYLTEMPISPEQTVCYESQVDMAVSFRNPESVEEQKEPISFATRVEEETFISRHPQDPPPPPRGTLRDLCEVVAREYQDMQPPSPPGYEAIHDVDLSQPSTSRGHPMYQMYAEDLSMPPGVQWHTPHTLDMRECMSPHPGPSRDLLYPLMSVTSSKRITVSWNMEANCEQIDLTGDSPSPPPTPPLQPPPLQPPSVRPFSPHTPPGPPPCLEPNRPQEPSPETSDGYSDVIKAYEKQNLN